MSSSTSATLATSARTVDFFEYPIYPFTQKFKSIVLVSLDHIIGEAESSIPTGKMIVLETQPKPESDEESVELYFLKVREASEGANYLPISPPKPELTEEDSILLRVLNEEHKDTIAPRKVFRLDVDNRSTLPFVDCNDLHTYSEIDAKYNNTMKNVVDLIKTLTHLKQDHRVSTDALYEPKHYAKKEVERKGVPKHEEKKDAERKDIPDGEEKKPKVIDEDEEESRPRIKTMDEKDWPDISTPKGKEEYEEDEQEKKEIPKGEGKGVDEYVKSIEQVGGECDPGVILENIDGWSCYMDSILMSIFYQPTRYIIANILFADTAALPKPLLKCNLSEVQKYLKELTDAINMGTKKEIKECGDFARLINNCNNEDVGKKGKMKNVGQFLRILFNIFQAPYVMYDARSGETTSTIIYSMVEEYPNIKDYTNNIRYQEGEYNDVLFFKMERFGDDKVFRDTVIYPDQTINVLNDKNKEVVEFDLQSVIAHHHPSLHYSSYLKCGDKWYYYNDTDTDNRVIFKEIGNFDDLIIHDHFPGDEHTATISTHGEIFIYKKRR